MEKRPSKNRIIETFYHFSPMISFARERDYEIIEKRMKLNQSSEIREKKKEKLYI